MRMSALGTALAALAFAAVAIPSEADAQIRAGTLTCEVAPGVGLIVGSRKEVTCSFQNARGELEIYDGAITRIGVDIGVTSGGRLIWNVVSGGDTLAPGALSGSYVGAGAQATVGAGLEANALVGGFRRTVTLQPLSVGTQGGLNVAGGVAELNLRLRPPPRMRR